MTNKEKAKDLLSGVLDNINGSLFQEEALLIVEKLLNDKAGLVLGLELSELSLKEARTDLVAHKEAIWTQEALLLQYKEEEKALEAFTQEQVKKMLETGEKAEDILVQVVKYTTQAMAFYMEEKRAIMKELEEMKEEVDYLTHLKDSSDRSLC